MSVHPTSPDFLGIVADWTLPFVLIKGSYPVFDEGLHTPAISGMSGMLRGRAQSLFFSLHIFDTSQGVPSVLSFVEPTVGE